MAHSSVLALIGQTPIVKAQRLDTGPCELFLKLECMSIRQCHAIVKDVLEFSGLADRAGDRLKVLSAGQKMRLGFSITTELESDILVMDEWIGTGDAEFFTRAQARLRGKLEGAKIVVLASHSVPLLKTVCNRAIYMENGAVVADGSIDDIVARHIPQPAAAKPQ